MKPVLAVDVGGVLASLQHEGVPREKAAEVLTVLSATYELWVVSQCGKQRAAMTRAWLQDHELPFPPERQRYVPFKEKKTPTLRRINAEYFIDDRMKHVRDALTIKTMRRVFHMPALPRDVPGEIPNDPRYSLVVHWEGVLARLTR